MHGITLAFRLRPMRMEMQLLGAILLNQVRGAGSALQTLQHTCVTTSVQLLSARLLPHGASAAKREGWHPRCGAPLMEPA